MSITRRLFLRNTAAAGAVGITVAAPVVAEAVETKTAQERYDFHLAEFQKAAEELDPQIGHWHHMGLNDGYGGAAIVITALRVSGRYVGDGIYEGSRETALGGYVRYEVRLIDKRIDGHRSFEVRTGMDRMFLTEPCLNTFVRAKVGDL